MHIEYKILTSYDIDRYREIRLECLKEYPNYFGTTYEEEVNSNSMKFSNALKINCQTNFLYGAFCDEDLIGICGFTQEERIKTKHRGEISQMFVKKNMEGKGIGTKLLMHTLNKAFNENKVEVVILGVVDCNKDAINVYSKLGFKQFGFVENYFKMFDEYFGFVFMVLHKAIFLKSKGQYQNE